MKSVTPSGVSCPPLASRMKESDYIPAFYHHQLSKEVALPK
ncbi:hypothetical protein [Prosthecobacter sp.]|jgi:hypothetical protein|nr:hypothetical protein [Prosthecobacter sp.]